MLTTKVHYKKVYKKWQAKHLASETLPLWYDTVRQREPNWFAAMAA